jgi:tartrate dehydratase alpha subunit/fumarate hydratase class I-like protein
MGPIDGRILLCGLVFMIKTELYEQVIFETIKKGATVISEDVRAVFRSVILQETFADAKTGLEKTLESMELSPVRDSPTCPDTGRFSISKWEMSVCWKAVFLRWRRRHAGGS